MFSHRVLEEKYQIDGTIYYKIYYGDSLVAADTGTTLRVWTLQGDLMSCQDHSYPDITCVALQGFQIAVGTEDGSVYILYCDTKKMEIEELNKLECPCVSQIRFLLDEGDGITRCMLFQPNKVSIFEWKFDTIKTYKEMLPKAIDVPGENFYHLDAIQKAEDPSEYLLFGINEEETAISVRLVNRDGFSEEVKPTWNSAQVKSRIQIQILDISSHGWVLLAEDTCVPNRRGVRLINVYSKSTYLADRGFMCGCLLSTTRAEASFVVQDIKPSALSAYKWNADKRERTLLQTWGTEAPDTKKGSAIEKVVAGCNGNFVMVWHHEWKEECAALLFCRNSPSIYPQPYKPSWLQPGSESDEIIESAYWRDDSGALLVRKTESYYVRRWTFDGNIFRLTKQLPLIRSKEEEVKYTRIAMHENIIAVCSEVIRNFVTVQLWRNNNEFSETFEIDKVDSEIIKLINLQSRYFCLITKNELIVFKDKSLPKRRNINHVKNACYDPKSGQLKVLANRTLEIYDTDLYKKKIRKHSKIHNKQTAMNSSGEDWVTIDDHSTLEYFPKGKPPLFKDFDGTLSLNLLSDENVIINNNFTGTMQCFSLQNGNLTLIWDLNCKTGPRNWQMKESGGRYFLLTEYTFGVIESDRGVYKERILFGFRERDVAEVYLPSGERILYRKARVAS
jgi:hypothetical protein